MEKRKRSESQQLFWPLLLIGAGLIWLLGNLGVISSANIAAVFRMWPLILVAIGIDILVGQQRPQLRPVLGLGMLVVFVLIALFGPALGLAEGSEIQTVALQEPLADADRADIRIDGESAPLMVTALADSNAIIDADIQDSGDVSLFVEGSSSRSISLERKGPNFSFFFFGPEGERHWNIGLTPEIPLALDFDLGSGSAALDLSLLHLTTLNLNGGSGTIELSLPPGDEAYSIRSDQGSGAWTINLSDAASIEWVLEDVGSGSLTVNVPDNLAVHLDVQDDGSGRLNLPGGWTQISGSDDEEGVWESADFESQDYRATITIEDRGSGSINFESGR